MARTGGGGNDHSGRPGKAVSARHHGFRVGRRNALFQQWQALLSNRSKRQRCGEFLIHGMRPITVACEQSWPLSHLLYRGQHQLSSWSRRVLESCEAPAVEVDPELISELGERTETPELIAVGRLRPDDLARLPVGPDFLGIVFDRPVSPGNIGTLVRSADALGASGIIVTGHAADVYDPKSVRASTGSLFAVPTVRVSSAQTVAEWVACQRESGVPITIVGTDEHGGASAPECDLTGPTLLVIGNETGGMSNAWHELSDTVARIPITGSASSLNAAAAGTLLLYEATRQRGFPWSPVGQVWPD